MNWIICSIISVFLIGIYNSFLQGAKFMLPKGDIYRHMYMSIIILIAGIMSAIVLVYYNYTKPKEFKSMFNSKIKNNYWIIIITALFLALYMYFNILALNAGGGIAMAIINLNMYVTIILGVLLFSDKINIKIIIAIIIGGLAMAYTAYENGKLQ